MNRLSREVHVSLNPLLKLKDTSQWVSEILAGFHMHSSFERDRMLMLGSSNCFCLGTRSTCQMLLSHHRLSLFILVVQLHCHHHLVPLEVAALVLLLLNHQYYLTTPLRLELTVAVRFRELHVKDLNPRVWVYHGIPSKLPSSSELQTNKILFRVDI